MSNQIENPAIDSTLKSDFGVPNDIFSHLEPVLGLAKQMREQIEQMRGLFDDDDSAIQGICDQYDVFIKDLLKDDQEVSAIDKRQNDYVAGKGCFCPNCGSRNIEANVALETDGLTAWGRVGCSQCESTWHDQYKLVGFSDLDAGPLSMMPVMK